MVFASKAIQEFEEEFPRKKEPTKTDIVKAKREIMNAAEIESEEDV